MIFGATGTASQASPTVITGGQQAYAGTTTVTTSTYLTSVGALSLQVVNGTGTQALTLNTTGTIALDDVIGGTTAATALGSLTTVGGQEVDFNGGSVRTNGAGGQTYSGLAVLGANTTLTAGGGGTVTAGAVTGGGFGLAVNASGSSFGVITNRRRAAIR